VFCDIYHNKLQATLFKECEIQERVDRYMRH